MRYGAIIGDIAGSRFEGVSNDYFSPVNSVLKPDDKWYRTDNTDYNGLVLKGRFTDDSVLTLAVAEAILLHKKTGEPLEQFAVKQLQEKGKAFSARGFGSSFGFWCYHDEPQPYGSYGNGAAMRISPCAWLADTYEQAVKYAHIITNVTHNHPDSIWGAEVVVTAIWLLRETKDKDLTAKYLFDKYALDLDAVHNSGFQINCKQAVSLAFKAFMFSHSFNETIHKAVCYGGDTDTIAAIAGSIAEAFYPIEPELIQQAETFFEADAVSSEWEEPAAKDFCKAFAEWEEPEHQKYYCDIEVNADTKKFIIKKDNVLMALKFLTVIAVFLIMLILTGFCVYDVIQERKSGEFIPVSYESPY